MSLNKADTIEPRTEEQRLRNALLAIATLNAEDYKLGTELQWAEANLFRQVREYAHRVLEPEQTIR